MICIFFIAAWLLVWQVKAQTQASQVVDFVRQLQSQNVDVRLSAVKALARIGPEAKEAVPALIAALKDKDDGVRSFAAEALGRIGKEAVPALIVALKDQNAGVRNSAVYTLGRIGPEAKEVVPALIAALKDKDDGVRSFAAEALGRIGKEAVPALIAALKDQNAVVRPLATYALGRIGKEAVHALIAALKDQDAGRRSSAAEALGEMRPEAKEAAPALIATLKDQDAGVRRYAAEALGRIGPGAKEAAPALIAALKDHDADVRRSAAQALGLIGPEAKEAVPALIAALTDHDVGVRRSAVYTLGRIGPEAKEAVPALIATLKDQDDEVRRYAAAVLGRIGPEAKEAAPALIATLKDQDAGVRRYAAEALGRIGPGAKEAAPALIAALKDHDAGVRRSAAATLGGIGPEAKEAAPALIVALKDQDAEVRYSAAHALGRIGPEAKESLPALIVALKDQDAEVRYSAAHALGRIGPEAKEAVPALMAALKDQDDIVRGSAATALVRIGKEAAPVFIAALKDQNTEVRSSAANSLGRMGPEAKEAVPALIAALKDQDGIVRSNAAKALGQIATALFDTRGTESLVQLKAAYEALSTHPDPEVKEQAVVVKRTINYFESLWWVEARNRAIKLIEDYPFVSIGIAIFLLLQLTWLLLFWLRPYWLLRISESIHKANQTLTILIPNFPISLKLPFSTLIFLYQARARVLNAWVQKYLDTVQKKFDERRASKDRQIHIAIPTVINKTDWDANTVTLLQPHFETAPTIALITGEGGAGKTSVAWQMATWAMTSKPQDRLCKDHSMIPVILEGGLDAGSDGKPDLIETVRGRLENLLGEKEERELITRLLNKRRLLVILDSFSEWDEESRKTINPGAADFPAKALIVTSRLQEEWKSDIEKTTIVMQRLKGKRLVAFMEDYLNERLKHMRQATEISGSSSDPLALQLDEGEPLDASKQVMEMNASRKLADPFDDREITVLLAKLYAEAMIVAKETSATGSLLPRNVPELMEQSVTDLNRNRQPGDPETTTVQRVAKVIAWQCLKQHHRPNAVDISTMLAEMRKETPDHRVLVNEEKPAPLSLDEAKKLLVYLEKSLRLIERTGSGNDQIRLSLDPLAEYLAGLYLVEHNRDSREVWQAFLADAEQQPGAPQATKGFLLAVRDCCEVRGSRFGVPAEVSDALARLAGFDSAAIDAARLKQRIKLLLMNLNSFNSEDRRNATEALGGIGSEAKEVAPALIAALKDQNAGVRIYAAEALGKIGPEAKEAVPALIAALKDQDELVRICAASALKTIKPETEHLLPP